jgi:lipopolysaccharide export system permease protein
MRTVTRYLAREIYKWTGLVFVAFLSLFAFTDLLKELDELGIGSYRLPQVFLFVLLSLPGHIYELFPMAVLIGTLVPLAMLAANSEYTVMRVSGFSPRQAGFTLTGVGMAFVIATILFGELAAPMAERAAQQLRIDRLGGAVLSELRTGLWVKSESRFVNVRQVMPDSTLKGVHIYEFDDEFRLVSMSQAAAGHYAGANTWRLSGVVETRFAPSGASVRTLEALEWTSVLTPEMLSVLLVVPQKLSAWDLYRYTQHLAANKQRSDRYEIALWKKLIYPFAALVMMALALPFAYIHVRTGGVGVKLFCGLMLGVLFHLLNNLFSHLAVLDRWPPFAAAAAPSAIFMLTAVVMMWWVERR